MSLKVPYASQVTFLGGIVSSKLNGASLHAYVSNHAPANGDTATTYLAIEATFGGYGSFTLNSWGSPFLNASNLAEVDEIVRTWTATGAGLPQTVYGVFVLDAAGNLLYAELNPTGGVTLSAAGQTFSYQPVFTDQSAF